MRTGQEINPLDTCRGVCAAMWALASLMYITMAFPPQCVQLFLMHDASLIVSIVAGRTGKDFGVSCRASVLNYMSKEEEVKSSYE